MRRLFLLKWVMNRKTHRSNFKARPHLSPTRKALRHLRIGRVDILSALPAPSAGFRILKQQHNRTVLLIDAHAFVVCTGKADTDYISVRVQDMVARGVVAGLNGRAP